MDKEYFAFISYQRQDEDWAKWLADQLEHYHLPMTLNGRDDLPKDLRPIFRDIDELAAGNLPQQIHQALENSKNLIVICSPNSAKSLWVSKEVEMFISLGKTDKIFPFIVDGKYPSQFFPPALRDFPKNKELLWGEVRKNGRDAAFLKIVAGMLDVDFDSLLYQRYEKEKAEEERKLREQRDNLAQESQKFKNFAFISYSHEDMKHAEMLDKFLLEFRLPTQVKEKHPNLRDTFHEIFRDNSGMVAATDLDFEIKRQLDQSEYLIVICSPNAVESDWVNKEIEYFKCKRGLEYIYPFVVDGIVNAKSLNESKECMPKALRPYKGRAANISTYSFEHAIIEILAAILNIEVDEIWQRHVRLEEERKQKLKEQRDNLLRIQSRLLAKEAKECIVTHQFDTASQIALEALPVNLENPNRPYVKEAEIALREATIDTSTIIRFCKGAYISNNGELFATAEDGYFIQIWDSHTWSYVKKVHLLELAPIGIDSYQQTHGRFDMISFWPKEETKKVLFSSEDSLFSVDYLSGQVTLLLSAESKDIRFNEVIFSPNQRYVLCIANSIYSSINKHQELFLLNIDTYDCVKRISYNSPVSFSFSPNSQLLAISSGHNIHILDISKDTYPYKCQHYDVGNCSFIDNSHLAYSCSDNTLRIWDFASGEEELAYQCDSKIASIICDESHIALSTSSNMIIVIDIILRASIATRKWHSKVLLRSFSEDGLKLYFTDENSFRTWDFSIRPNGQRLIYYHFSPISCVAYSVDNSIFVSASDESIKVWDIQDQRIKKEFPIECSITQMVVSPKYKKIIFDNLKEVWSLNSDSGEVVRLCDHSIKLLLSPDEKIILSAFEDSIVLFDVTSSEKYQTIKIPDNQFLFGTDIVSFSPNGDKIAAITSPDDPSLMMAALWDTKTGKKLASILFEAGYVESISFSDNGESIIIDNCLRWDINNNNMQDFIKEGITQELSPLTNNKIVIDDKFVLEENHIPLQQLIDKTRDRFKDRPLTPEERKKYYID